MVNSSFSAQDIEAIAREVVSLLGESGLPGGANAIPAFDAGYGTQAKRTQETLVRDQSSVPYGLSPSDSAMQVQLATNETRSFQLIASNQADDTQGSTKAYGLAISAPGTPKAFSAVAIGPAPGGAAAGGLCLRQIGLSDINGNSMGRFGSGTVVVIGTVTNGDTPGLLKLAYGAPESTGQLGLLAGTEIDGTGSITFPLAGEYVLEISVDFTVDIDDTDTTATNPYATIVPDTGDPSFCILKAGSGGAGLPSWFKLTDEGGGTHDVEVDATVLKMLLQGLQTSDPGGGLVWLSNV